MTIDAVCKPLGVGVLALVAAGCADAGDSSLDRHRGEQPGPADAGQEALVWGGEQRLEASDSAELDQLGYAVSLDGDRALAGAHGDALYRGAAYVFVRSGSFFTEEQKLVPSDGVESSSFGWSVSLSGDRALVGAYGGDSSRGKAYVFVRSGSAWVEEQTLVASDGAEGDNFGWSVSLSGDRALVGAYGHAGTRGAAYVFVRNGGIWSEEQELVATDGAQDDKLGYSVSLADDRALVAAPASDAARGAAYAFVRSGTSWSAEEKLVASDGAQDDHFGVSVALAGNRALVGAYWDDSLRGAAYVFVRSGSSSSEEQKLVASDGAEGNRFGNAVSLSADRALVGAYASNGARGAAYAFVRSPSSWLEEQTLVASDGAEGDAFGWSVALGAEHALIGAYFDDNSRGVAYVFSRELESGVTDTDGGR